MIRRLDSPRRGSAKIGCSKTARRRGETRAGNGTVGTGRACLRTARPRAAARQRRTANAQGLGACGRLRMLQNGQFQRAANVARCLFCNRVLPCKTLHAKRRGPHDARNEAADRVGRLGPDIGSLDATVAHAHFGGKMLETWGRRCRSVAVAWHGDELDVPVF